MGSESNNATLTRKIVQAISDYQFDAVLDYVTDDLIVEQPYAALGQPERYQGRDDFVAGLKFIPGMFKEFKLTIKELYDCPSQDVIIFEQDSRGILNLDGSVYQNHYVMLYKFRDGKVALWREYYNPEIMTRDLGPVIAKMQEG